MSSLVINICPQLVQVLCSYQYHISQNKTKQGRGNSSDSFDLTAWVFNMHWTSDCSYIHFVSLVYWFKVFGYEYCQAEKKSPFLHLHTILSLHWCASLIFSSFLLAMESLIWWLGVFIYLQVWIRCAWFCFCFNDLGRHLLPPYIG